MKTPSAPADAARKTSPPKSQPTGKRDEGGIPKGVMIGGGLLALGTGLAVYMLTLPERESAPKKMTESPFARNSPTVKLGAPAPEPAPPPPPTPAADPRPAPPPAPPPAAPPPSLPAAAVPPPPPPPAAAPVPKAEPTPVPKPEPAPPPAPPAPAPVPAPAPKASAVPAAPKAAERWTFKGKVYNLVNLAPVYDAKLTFLDESGAKKGETLTGDEGRFQITLDGLPAGGYTVAVEHPDYKSKYLDEISPPFKEVAEADRQALINSVPRNRPWIGKASGTTSRDFVMVPNPK